MGDCTQVLPTFCLRQGLSFAWNFERRPEELACELPRIRLSPFPIGKLQNDSSHYNWLSLVM